jgi:hypothetical protein
MCALCLKKMITVMVPSSTLITKFNIYDFVGIAAASSNLDLKTDLHNAGPPPALTLLDKRTMTRHLST